jgi:hypothetical protein
MKEKKWIPGPARAMYLTYLGILAVVVYTGYNYFGQFMSGWRYPWASSFARDLNFHASWFMAILAVVYIYYATLGRPKGWKEPLGWARIALALLAVWFFLLTYAVYQPYGWLEGMVNWLGGVDGTFRTYRFFLPLMLLFNSLYLIVYYFVARKPLDAGEVA